MGLFGAEFDRRFAVWQRGNEVLGFDPAMTRKDDFGNFIDWVEYGNHESVFGWEIDHITPAALGGSDALWNLRPLSCSKNRSLGGLLAAAMDASRDTPCTKDSGYNAYGPSQTTRSAYGNFTPTRTAGDVYDDAFRRSAYAPRGFRGRSVLDRLIDPDPLADFLSRYSK